MQQDYIGKKAVTNIVDTGKKTPLGSPILKVHFEDGLYEYMPEKRFLIIKTNKPTDATYVKGILVAHASRDIGSVCYGMLHEFGCKLSEIEMVTSQMIVMANVASERATNFLWQIDYAEERTLNAINDILLEHVSKNDNNNGGSSNGKGTSDANKNPL